MKQIVIFVEGPTEENFVKRILSPYFSLKNIYLEPKLFTTKKFETKENKKGGTIKFEKDVSQVLLISSAISSPIVLVIGISSVIFSLNYFGYFPFWKSHKHLIILGNLGSLLIVTGLISYLAFWTYQVIKKNHSHFFVN